MKRIVIAIAIAIACGFAGYFIGGAIVASSDRPAAAYVARNMSGSGFQIWIMSIAASAGFFGSLGVLHMLAKRKSLASLRAG